MKNILSKLVLAFCLVFSLMPAVAFAADTTGSVPGSTLTYSLSGSSGGKTLTISGTGSMPDNLDNNDTWVHNITTADVTDIVIVEGVTSIPDGTFNSCTNLRTAKVPDSVSSFSDNAFNSQTNFTMYAHLNSEAGRFAESHANVQLKVEELRVLGLGNSHTMMNEIYDQKMLSGLNDAGIIDTKINYEYIVPGRSSMDSSVFYPSAHPAFKRAAFKQCTLANHISGQGIGCGGDQRCRTQLLGINKTWDIIIVQDFMESANRCSPTEFAEGLKMVADLLRAEDLQPGAKVAWFADWVDVWGTSTESGLTAGITVEQSYTNSQKCMDEVLRQNIVDFVVPGCFGLQNVRTSYLGQDDKLNFLMDGTHVDERGRFIIAAVKAQAILSAYQDNLLFADGFESISVSDSLYQSDVFSRDEVSFIKDMAEVSVAYPNRLTYALVGDTSYSDLASAVSAVHAGDTIEIFGMCKSASDLEVPEGVNVVMYNNTGCHTLGLTSGGTITSSGIKANGPAFVIDGRPVNSVGGNASGSIDASEGIAKVSKIVACESVSNEGTDDGPDESNMLFGARLHDDFSGFTGEDADKNVYFENYTQDEGDKVAQPALVRVQLTHELTTKRYSTSNTVTDISAGTPLEYTADGIYANGKVNVAFGGSGAYYIPTFNKILASPRNDVRSVNVETQPDYSSATYTKVDATTQITGYETSYEDGAAGKPDTTHNAKAIPASSVMTLAQYQAAVDDGNRPQNVWVYDTDGFYYWAGILQPGDVTGLLIDKATVNVEGGWKYALNVQGAWAKTYEPCEVDGKYYFDEDAKYPCSKGIYDMYQALLRQGN